MYQEFNFKKKLGQNFLHNKAVIEKIVKTADIKDNSLVLEVGPGSGAMTTYLAKNKKVNILCYEIDTALEDILAVNLNESSNVKVLYGDFLKQRIKEDIKDYDYQNLYFVSNVPYYITTPILFKLITEDLNFTKIVMMVQKEVGMRFTAEPSRKEYGALTVLLNYYFDIKKEFIVDRNQFTPRPNVDSIVVSFTPKEDILKLKDKEFFEKLVHASFQFKRKTIRNNLKSYNLDKIEEVLKKYGYDLTVRAENLDYKVFVDLANNLV